MRSHPVTTKRFIGILALAMVFLGGGGPALGQPLEKIRMASWGPKLSEQADFFIAQELGFFKGQGIDFEYVPGQGSGDALKHLIAENVLIAFAGPEGIFFAVERGGRIKAVYNTYPENAFAVFTLKGSGITTPRQLKGKKIGVLSLASGARYNLVTLLGANGIRESEVEVIAIGLSAAPLVEGKVDAWSTTDATLRSAQIRKFVGEVNAMWVRDSLNLPTDVFAVTEATFRDRKEVVRRWLRAFKKGTEFAIAQPAEAARIAQKYAVDGKDLAHNEAMIRIRMGTSQNESTRKHGLGWFDLGVIRLGVKKFVEFGLMKQTIPVDEVFTNELIPGL